MFGNLLSNGNFVLEKNHELFRGIANPRGVTCKARTTVPTSNIRAEIGRQNANPSQNKKSCKPTHKPTQIAAHFILPNRTQAHPPPDQRTSDILKIYLLNSKPLS